MATAGNATTIPITNSIGSQKDASDDLTAKSWVTTSCAAFTTEETETLVSTASQQRRTIQCVRDAITAVTVLKSRKSWIVITSLRQSSPIAKRNGLWNPKLAANPASDEPRPSNPKRGAAVCGATCSAGKSQPQFRWFWSWPEECNQPDQRNEANHDQWPVQPESGYNHDTTIR